MSSFASVFKKLPFMSTSSSSSTETAASAAAAPSKLFTSEENVNDKLVGVVVTISSGSSYDPMFREVQPVTVDGERVSTYSISCEAIEDLYLYLTAAAPPSSEMWQSLVQDVQAVPADSVVFNWECCSACGAKKPFPCRSRGLLGLSMGPSITMRFMGYAVGAGFTVMCSDFSLKSLIHEWSADCLGPNPFKIVGSCSKNFTLEFVPQELQNEEVPQQLQVVGELCAADGRAVVRAMGNTIAYTVNRDREQTDRYDLKVLTVVTADGSGVAQGLEHYSQCETGSGAAVRTGCAGHVTLTYGSGGQLVTSNGHWIELTRINTSIEAVVACAHKNYGSKEVHEFEQEYASKATASEQAECVQERAKKLVQQSVSTRMKCRTKY
mmetsp:Transcript_28416/g.65911  ORF Transcript_28416/g.65911 Transcript_28416/m.65911 type:complete len:381 (-) Transcript_28416:169-1311(-)